MSHITYSEKGNYLIATIRRTNTNGAFRGTLSPTQ